MASLRKVGRVPAVAAVADPIVGELRPVKVTAEPGATMRPGLAFPN